MTWEQVALADIADIQGGIQKQPKRAPQRNAFPFLRVANVTSRGLELSDVHKVELFGDELERLRLQRGDLLVVEGNGSPSQIGRAAVWDGSIDDCVHQNHLIRVRPGTRLHPSYLGLVWNSPAVRDELTAVSSSTSGLHTLSVAKLKRIVLPLPSLREQARVVEILEDHLSLLDAADAGLGLLEARSMALEESWMCHNLIPTDGERVTVGEALTDSRGGWSRSAKHLVGAGAGRPYLKMNNITRRGLWDLRDLAHVVATTDDVAKYGVLSGDVLFNSKNSGDLIGKTAVAGHEVEGATFNENIMRLRFRDSLNPDFAGLWFLGPEMRRSIRLAARASTNVAAVYRHQLIHMPMWVPSRERQDTLVAEFEDLRRDVQRILGQRSLATIRSQVLRRAVLTAAFEGKLMGLQTDSEVIEELAFA